MNKDLMDQLSADEKQMAEKISAAAEQMKLAQSFQWDLETKLMEAYPSQNEKRNSLMNFLKPAGWVMAAIAGVLLLSWILRTLLPGIQPAAEPTPTQEVSFEHNVRTGTICTGPLALGHGFSLFLTNQDKTQFVAVDAGNTVGEMRSFQWSAAGGQLSILGNTTGSGNIYLTDASGGELRQVLPPGELGYMRDAGWSHDRKRIAMWSSQNNMILYVMNADGTGLVKRQLDVRILGTPQFWPDGSSIVFYGATPTSVGLFELTLIDSEATLINSFVEDASSYAFSPDGSHVALMEYDRDLGEARLISQDLATDEASVLGTFPISKGSGSSVPDTANLSWSADATWLVFDVGRGAFDRVIYLAYADGSGMVKVVDRGYAPSISSDGKCLAYIRNKQVFLLDLTSIAPASVTSTPMLLAEMPAGRGRRTPDYQQDQLKWRP